MLYREEASVHIHTCRAVPIQKEYVCSCNASYTASDLFVFKQHIRECDRKTLQPLLPASQDISSDLKALSIGDSDIKSPLARAILRLRKRTAQERSEGPLRIIGPSVSEGNATAAVTADDEGEDRIQLPTNHSHPNRTAVDSTKDWFEDWEVPKILMDLNQSIEEALESRSHRNQASSNGYDSPTDGHSTVTDSDLLSVSDTSDLELCLNLKPLSQMNGHLPDHILRDQDPEGGVRSKKGTWAHRRVPALGGGNDAVTAAEGTMSETSVPARSRMQGHGMRYDYLGPAAVAGPYTDHDAPVPAPETRDRGVPADISRPVEIGASPEVGVAKRSRDDSVRPKVFACPFWKHNQEKYRQCCKLRHKRIRDVKQHLRRRHTPEIYCDRCLKVFDDTERYDIHVQSTVACFRVPKSRLDGITRMQSKALSKKSRRNLGEEDQWFVIWDTLFPGVARPAAAYVDSELTEEMNSFQGYWKNRGHNVLMDELNSSDIWVLSPDQRETKGREILSRGLNLIYEQWNASRRNASTTQAATDMLIPPTLTDTTISSSSFIPDVSQAIQAPTIMSDQEGVGIATAASILGDGMPERDQIDFGDFGFTDFHNIETTEDLDFDFD